MKIIVVGMGYVGLTLSVLLSQQHEVVGLDIDSNRVDLVNKRKAPFKDYELESYLSSKTLNLSSHVYDKKYFKNADCVIIATPTDFNNYTNKLDITGVENIINDCFEVKTRPFIVIKSTVPIGTTNDLNRKFNTDRIIFSPEFLREGKALYDNLYPSRIIIGGKREYCNKFGNALSGLSLNNINPIIFSNPSDAEAVKIFSNSYLAMRVAFFNEVDSFSIVKGLNSENIINGICLEERIGNFYNNPSFGYGGYCLPKDTKQLVSECEHVPSILLKSISLSNKKRAEFIAEHIAQQNVKIIGIYRLLAKTGSDNTRYSSTKNIINQLKKFNVQILLYEPILFDKSITGVDFTSDLKFFKKRSDIIVSNRFDNELMDVEEKVYTRDIFQRD